MGDAQKALKRLVVSGPTYVSPYLLRPLRRLDEVERGRAEDSKPAPRRAKRVAHDLESVSPAQVARAK